MHLRRALRAPHDVLDDLLSKFDLTSQDGLACFLRVHQGGLSTIARSAPSEDLCRVVNDLEARAKKDLITLGCCPTNDIVGEDEILDALDPVALDYILGGSQMGNSVLKKRWEAATDPTVRSASAFFSATSARDLWPRYLSVADTMPGTSTRAEGITRDASRIFQIYADLAKAELTQRSLSHAE
ncbi:hypothetical protein [Tropicimonas sp. S265A]|uniref:hypothetical protein n=1 Tax=Tropicimonas sp. S265A TaxID=3415134 RepID=UPI003C7C6075